MRRRLIAVSVAVVALAGTAIAASAATLHFGYHNVRQGLPSGIGHFSLSSTDIQQGRPIPMQFWGCTDTGISPELSWSGAPAATQSYAVTIFDPDAPTGSGFWHWQAWDIPATTTSLPTGATLPAGAVNGRNDGGGFGYTGPCPPAGDLTHHYDVTVVALNVPSLELPADTPNAVVGFVLGQDAIASASLTATARQ
jgi:Raf kinase inhibitor-like YbhB/YbcL family protein